MRERLRRRVERWQLGRAVLGAAGGYSRHATSQFAAAISYRVLFSLVPLAAFITALADAVLPDEQQQAVANWLISIVPGKALDPSVEHALTGSRVAPSIAGAVSLVVLLWTASSMMGAIRVAFRIIWANDRRRTYVRSKLIDFMLVLGVGLLAVASLGATLLVHVLVEIGKDLGNAFGGRGTDGQVLGTTAELLTSVGLTFAVLVVIYRTVPPVAPRLRAIWLPALLAALGFHAATALYALYLDRFGDVAAVYGPLASVLGFLLVVYVGVIIILLGAELVAQWPDDSP